MGESVMEGRVQRGEARERGDAIQGQVGAEMRKRSGGAVTNDSGFFSLKEQKLKVGSTGWGQRWGQKGGEVKWGERQGGSWCRAGGTSRGEAWEGRAGDKVGGGVRGGFLLFQGMPASYIAHPMPASSIAQAKTTTKNIGLKWMQAVPGQPSACRGAPTSEPS